MTLPKRSIQHPWKVYQKKILVVICEWERATERLWDPFWQSKLSLIEIKLHRPFIPFLLIFLHFLLSLISSQEANISQEFHCYIITTWHLHIQHLRTSPWREQKILIILLLARREEEEVKIFRIVLHFFPKKKEREGHKFCHVSIGTHKK